MDCPKCGESFKLIDWFKFWITVNMPSFMHRKLEQRTEDRDLEKLKQLYTSAADLTAREHEVCVKRIHGQSYESVADSMVVTRERVRQIQAKALRKLKKS